MEHVLDHAARARARLLEQFKDVRGVGIILDALNAQVQAIEDALWSLFTERGLDTAAGEPLDVIGRVLSESRAGFDDASYRERLRAKIRVLRSSGGPLDILKIFKQLLPANTIFFSSIGGASFVLELGTINTSFLTIYQGFLREAKSAGIDGQLNFSGAPEGSLFTYDNTTGTYAVGLGYSDTAGVGGGEYTGATG